MNKLKILLITALLSLSNTAIAEVTKFVFVTEPQTVEEGVASKTITIQSQNSDGVEEDVTETIDVVFTSTSDTGVFLSTTGNPVSGTMSRNTSNKNFIYQDGASGEHTLRVDATGRTTGKTYTASQLISVVSAGASPISSTSTSTTTTENTTSNQNTNTQTQVVVVYSSHSSPAPLSSSERKMEFEVTAGRTRLASVGNSILFSGSPTKLQNISERAISYEWSFGDGVSQRGQDVNHAYNFSGEYTVVLNAYAGDKVATSRTSVKVIEPAISINRISGGLEIANNSSQEINIEGWKILSDKKEFVFPKDTIILKGGKVVFDDRVTGVVSPTLQLLNQSNKTFARTTLAEEKMEPQVAFDNKDFQVKINEIKEKVSEISSAYNNLPKSESNYIAISSKVALVPEESASNNSKNIELNEAQYEQTASVVSVFQGEKKVGTVSKLLAWPIFGIDYLFSLFSEN